MKLEVYEEFGELERRMDDLMRSLLGPRARFMRPAQAEIEAVYQDGVLEVIVLAAAKALESTKPRTIPIKTALPVKAAKVA
jgi:hypothetical protein